MTNIDKAIWRAKMANKYAALTRNVRALVDRNAGTLEEVARCYTEYSRLRVLTAYYLRAASGAPVIADAPAVNMTVWDY